MPESTPPEARNAMHRLIGPDAAPDHLPRPDAPNAPLQVGDYTLAPSRVIDLLRPFMRDRRLNGIREIVAKRTRTVVPVIEGVVNTGNVSAVMRSTEAMGYQDLHVIATGGRYKHSERTAKGAQRWLDVHQWDAPVPCVEHLQERGYRVAAMYLDDEAVPIASLDFTTPTALVFGNERDGVSEALRDAADISCIIPMDGFTESFNISVAAAVGLYHARHDRMQRQGTHADLSEAEQIRLTARLCMRSVTKADSVLQRVLREQGEMP
ncbi:TrmH family RNA methyltransferase [Longimonas halophila]|nr:RNA methyltransferase [Longimonas halophila]